MSAPSRERESLLTDQRGSTERADVGRDGEILHVGHLRDMYSLHDIDVCVWVREGRERAIERGGERERGVTRVHGRSSHRWFETWRSLH